MPRHRIAALRGLRRRRRTTWLAIAIVLLLALVAAVALTVDRTDQRTGMEPTNEWRTPLDSEARTKTSAALVVDGRPKLAAVVSGGPAELQVLDVETGEVDSAVGLPGMVSGEAIAVGGDGHIYVGGDSGHVFRYSPGSAAADDLGAATPGTTNIFDMSVAPDGSVWGGSYPTGELLHLDPASGRIDNLGQVRPGATYARSVTVDGRYAYVAVGATRPEIIRVDVRDPASKTRIALPEPLTAGIISEVRVLGNFLAVRLPSGSTANGTTHPAQRRLYDLRRGSWDVPANVTGQSPSPVDSRGEFHYVADGQLWGVSATTGTKRAMASVGAAVGRDRHIVQGGFGDDTADWMLTFVPQSQEIKAVNLTTFDQRTLPARLQPVPMAIKSLSAGDDGRVFVGGFGGASLAIVNLRTGATTHLPRRPIPPGPGTIGEIEGTIAHGRYQYLGSYTGGKIFRYDRSRPWVDGTNPQLIASLGSSHGQDRPVAWATAGPRTLFGTIPTYGEVGGGLGVIHSDQADPTFVRNVVPEQSVVALTAVGDVAYGGTSRWGGLGAPTSTGDAKVFAYDTRLGRKLWEVAPEPGAQSIGSIVADDSGRLWVAGSGTLYQVDRRTGATLRKVTVHPPSLAARPTYASSALVVHEGAIYFQSGDKIHAVDPDTLDVTTVVPSGVTAPRLALVDQQLVYPAGTRLKTVIL